MLCHRRGPRQKLYRASATGAISGVTRLIACGLESPAAERLHAKRLRCHHSACVTVPSAASLRILVSAQASIHFAVSTFWFLWAPTIVDDGRFAQLSVIYPCFLASRMLGSAGFPWFYGATAPFRNEDSLTMAYIGAGLALSIVAHDYQEIVAPVIVFCILHACVGFILPSLAILRTMYLPNELRGGMRSFSLSLVNASIFVFLLQSADHRRVANSTIMGLASYGLLGAGGCIHMLIEETRRWRKHTRQNARSL